MAHDERKKALIAQLETARARAALNFHALKRDLDFPTRARRAFVRQPFVWMGSVALAGVALTWLPFRRKKVTVPRFRKGKEAAVIEKAGAAGLLLGILKMGFDVARPAITSWLTRLVKQYAVGGPKPGVSKPGL